jgi:hypothetical protein
MHRCELQYLHPQRQIWVDCAQKVTAATEILIDGARHLVCPEHQDQVRQPRVPLSVRGRS